jgi:prefoldin subunit 5
MMNEVQKLDIRCEQIESKLAELEERIARLERRSRSSENAAKGFGSIGVKMVASKSKR